ncbi:MAG: redox-regulated ATPase YchF [Phycisphaeraceae bacterium]|nr:redox-regulated ATPase YchF [Phycisphaeraceae bacterium]
MEAGIVGLSYIGKTSLFNALTALGVGSESSSAKPNVGVISVPDPRLAVLNKYIETKKLVPASIQLVDVAGLVAGASEGKGMGNKFLSHIRTVDAILHVVRCFDDPSVPHIDGSVNPIRDIGEVETELILADMEVVDNSIRNAERKARTGDREAKVRLSLMEKCQATLGDEKPLRELKLPDEEAKLLKSFSMLTSKPVLYVANVGENDLEGKSPHVTKVKEYAAAHGGEVVCVCAKLEAELAELEGEERREMLAGLGLTEPALDAVARAAYHVLGLQSFFTAGPKEIKAWTVHIGAKAPIAAGVIHSDIERGFIRAEIYSVADLEKHHTEAAIRQAGKLRTEGKDYVMQDSDVCHFLFNV